MKYSSAAICGYVLSVHFHGPKWKWILTKKLSPCANVSGVGKGGTEVQYGARQNVLRTVLRTLLCTGTSLDLLVNGRILRGSSLGKLVYISRGCHVPVSRGTCICTPYTSLFRKKT